MNAQALAIDRASTVPPMGSARAASGDSGRPALRLIREHLGAGAASGPLTEKTVKYMAQMIRASARDPRVLQVVDEVKANAARTGESVVACLWWWVKLHVRFVHHDKQICSMLGECGPANSNYQMLIEPRALLRLRSMEGDCAVFTMLVDTLALALGYSPRIATIEADRRRPGEYSHVYGEVYLADGGWCPLDASHGTGPGWEVPERDIARKTEWDLDGNIVSDFRPRSSKTARAPAASSGLAGEGESMPYQRRGPGSHAEVARYVALVRAARDHGRRGMGQDEGFDPSTITDFNPAPSDYLPGGGIVDTGIVPTVSVSSPTDWTKLIQSLTAGAGAGSQIFRSLTPPSLVPGTNAIFNPATGQFYNPATGQVVNPTGVSPTSNIPLAGLTSSPVLIVGGLVLGGVLLFALARKN